MGIFIGKLRNWALHMTFKVSATTAFVLFFLYEFPWHKIIKHEAPLLQMHKQ